MMTEVEYVLANFDRHFAPFREKNILLHGSRNYAEAIIERFAPDYHFAGVMSLDPLEGPSWHGLPVLCEDDLGSRKIDLVILTERVKYAETAFASIRRVCRENHTAIYNMYGLDEFHVHYEAGTSGFIDLDDALRLSSSYDIIAFEVMHTVFPVPPGQEILKPRKIFADLIPMLRSQGKELRFSLRKSYPENVQIKALAECGLVQDEAEELIRRTGEDLSFRTFRESAPGKKILYFGGALVNEFILPRCYGIDSVFFADRTHDIAYSPEPDKKQAEKGLFLPGEEERIREMIRKHSIISFDIFDTLIFRKTLYPRDVYELTERRAIEAGYDAKGFALVRARVEDNCPYCDLDRIYRDLSELYGWDEKTREAMKKLELDVERAVLEPRPEAVSLFSFALGLGKRVILTSDMYLPAPVLRGILEEKGITGFEKIFVSCSCKKAKQNGLFGELLKLCGEPSEILHIGDNPEADGKSPEAFGIDSVVIPSSLMLAVNTRWAGAVKTAESLADRCMVGLAVSRLFADPFQDPNLWKRPCGERMAYLGNSVIGPLMTGHMSWLVRKLMEDRYDGVLFLSRDGWFPIRLYERIRGKLSLPEGIYYYANRRSAFLCCADHKLQADHIDVISKAFGLGPEQLLEKVYMIPKDEHLPRESKELNAEYIEKHWKQIRQTAESARAGYLNYSKRLGMRPGGKYAVVDFVAEGRIQKFLSEVLPFSFQGFYYGRPASKTVNLNRVDYYLRGDNPSLLRGYVDLENFFSSPEPAVDYMSEEGVPVFREEVRSEEDFRKIRAAWDAAESYGQEFFDLFYFAGESVSPNLIEEMYAAVTYLGIDFPVYDDWFLTEVKKRRE